MALGGEASFHVSISGDYALPVYLEVVIAKDVSASSATDKKEDTCRGTAGDKIKRYTPGKKDKSISLEVCHRNTDAAWNAIVDSEDADTPIEVLFLDGPYTTSGSKGFRFMANVFSYEADQPLDDPMNDTFEFNPTALTDDEYEKVVIA